MSITLTKKFSHTSAVDSVLTSGEKGILRISEENSALIMSSLINLYSDPLTASARELISNALDAIEEASKERGREGLYVKVDALSGDDGDQWGSGSRTPLFTVSDNGVGMSRDTLINIYTVMGASTKADDMSLIGARGLGAKSPLAAFSSFTVSTVKDEKKNTIVVGVDEGGNFTYTLFDEVDVPGEPSGTVVTIPCSQSQLLSLYEVAHLYLDTLPEHMNYFLNGRKCSAECGSLNPYLLIFESDLYQIFMSPSSNFMNLDNNIKVNSIIVGGFTYEPSSEHAPSRWEVSAAVNIVARPGVVDFTPSRDAIVMNSRYDAFMRDVTKNFRENVAKFIGDNLAETCLFAENGLIGSQHLARIITYCDASFSVSNDTLTMLCGDGRNIVIPGLSAAQIERVLAIGEFVKNSANSVFIVDDELDNTITVRKTGGVMIPTDSRNITIVSGKSRGSCISAVREAMRGVRRRRSNASLLPEGAPIGHDELIASERIVPLSEESARVFERDLPSYTYTTSHEIRAKEKELAEKSGLAKKESDNTSRIKEANAPLSASFRQITVNSSARLEFEESRMTLTQDEIDQAIFIVGEYGEKVSNTILRMRALRPDVRIFWFSPGHNLRSNNAHNILPRIVDRVAYYGSSYKDPLYMSRHMDGVPPHKWIVLPEFEGMDLDVRPALFSSPPEKMREVVSIIFGMSLPSDLALDESRYSDKYEKAIVDVMNLSPQDDRHSRPSPRRCQDYDSPQYILMDTMSRVRLLTDLKPETYQDICEPIVREVAQLLRARVESGEL